MKLTRSRAATQASPGETLRLPHEADSDLRTGLRQDLLLLLGFPHIPGLDLAVVGSHGRECT
ncbi:hypothetical protein AB0I16_26900 [Streptomyces sp. NPDC050703]|uniref:hypothetical protein n=1 Tax=Streptomyces sp. NPDC050703 TaxID=3157218 RepID=UPI00341BD4E5